MVLKKIERAAITSWSPASDSEPLLALGTVAGALDASFSSKTVLEIFSLNLNEHDKKLKKLAEVSCNARFNRISWQKNFIACGKENGEVDIWDPKKILGNAQEKALKFRAKNHSGPVRGLDFNSIDTNLLASGATEGEILIWDMNQLNQPYAPGAKSQRLEDLTCLAWNKQVGHILACGSSNGYTVVWDLRNRRELISIPYPGGRKPVTCISWNPDKPTQMVTCNDDDSDPVILMWDLRNASAAEKTFAGHSKGIMSMDWCPKDSDILLSGGKDNRTIVWDTNTGHPIGDLAHSANWTFDTKWCPRNPDLCVIASFDGMVTLHSLQGSSDHPEDDAFSPQPAHVEPQIIDPNDPFSQIGVQHHQQRKMSQPVFSLPHPPKWLRRPVGAVWGFGGKVAIFDTNHGATVKIKTIPVSDEISFRADQLDYILKENNPETSAQYCDYMANSEFMHDPKEKDFWNFLKGLFSSHENADMSGFLNYDPSYSKEERLSKLVKKLSVSVESDQQMNGELSPEIEKSKAVPFALYSTAHTEESDIDALVTKAVSVSDFEHAVNICLGANRMADALVLALSGSPELLEKAQRAYFKKQAGTRPYIRMLKAIVEGDLNDIISNAKLDNNNTWRDLVALISTYAKAEDFATYFSILGKRIIDPASGIKDQTAKSHAAVLCFVGSGELEKVVELWCEPKKGKLSPNDVSIQSLAERLSMVRQAIRYEDPELNLEHSSDGVSPLNNLYEIYVKYAWLASIQGNLDVAWRFLEQVPISFIPAEGDITVLRDRVYSSHGHVLAATGQPPMFPFEFVDVINYEEQQRQLQAQADAQAQLLAQQTRQQSYYNQPLQNSQPMANHSQNAQQPPWQQPPPTQWQPPQSATQAPPLKAQRQPSFSSPNQWQQPPPPVSNQWQNQPAPVSNQWQTQQNSLVSPPPVPRNQWQNQTLPPPPVTNQWSGSNPTNSAMHPPYSAVNSTPITSTGHAAPMPSYFQPQVNYSRSNSFSAPPQVPESQNGKQKLKVAPDRSQITNPKDKACYDSLTKLWAELKSSYKNMDKKLIEEAERKLDVLYDQMNQHKISAPILSDLQAICNALAKHDFQTARRIQSELMTKQFDATGTWIVGIKRLIDNMERSLKPVLSPPTGNPPFVNTAGQTPTFINQQSSPQASSSLPPPPTTSWNNSPSSLNSVPPQQRVFAAHTGGLPQQSHFTPPPVSALSPYSTPPVAVGPPPLAGPTTSRPLAGPPTSRPPVAGPPPLAGPPTSRPPAAGPSTSRPPVVGPPPISGPSMSRPPISGPPPASAYRPTSAMPSGPSLSSQPTRPPVNVISGSSRPPINGSQQMRPPQSTAKQFSPAPPPAHPRPPNVQRPPMAMNGNQSTGF